uniref:Ig-like domain-containing protein n=1 Tax=Sinocyclocheilus anshuiensis TaxID=1608454 RepID=A0A671LNP3_9TELE
WTHSCCHSLFSVTSDIVFSHPGDDVVLSCHLKPAISAASMEIQWWHKEDPVFHYKNGQVTVNIDFEGRVSLPLQNLQNGNVSLTLRDVRSSQKGLYICEVTHEIVQLQVRGKILFKLQILFSSSYMEKHLYVVYAYLAWCPD